jgi:hypothetical protein
MIMDCRSARSWMLLVPFSIGACGDDDSDSAGDLGSASAEDGPELTSDATQTEGDSGNGTGLSDGSSTSAGTTSSADDGTSTQSTADATGDSGSTTAVGTDSGGTMVDSCAECGPDELCVELTEFAGPADGGGPMVSYTCHDVPAACGDTITCECAGFLCPGDGGGAEGMCETDGEILYCSVAYP